MTRRTCKFFLFIFLLGLLGLLGPFSFVGVGQNCVHYTSRYPSLQAALNAGVGCLVIVDQSYTGLAPLQIPRRTHIKGLGPQANPVLTFSNQSGSSLTIARPSGSASRSDYVVIENLSITGPNSGTSIGLDLAKSGIVYLRNLVIRNFDIGVYGDDTYSVFADRCNVSSNRTDNYQLDKGSNSWRIQGGLCSQAGRYGINIISGNDNLIDVVRLESNKVAAIRTAGRSTHIAHNRFESNGRTPTDGLLIDTGAAATTLVDNYYSSDDVVDNSNPSSTLRFDNGFLGQFPIVNRYLVMSHIPSQSAGEVFGSYIPPPANSYKTLLAANNFTQDDSQYRAGHAGYGSWVLEMEGRPATAESSSQFRLYYRPAGAAAGKGPAVFSVSRGGQVSATTVDAAVNTVPFSAAPTFDASLGNTQKITLTGSVTGSTLVNARAGQQVNFIICQDARGGHTFTWPRNVVGGMVIAASGPRCRAQSFIYDGTSAYALSSGSPGQ